MGDKPARAWKKGERLQPAEALRKFRALPGPGATAVVGLVFAAGAALARFGDTPGLPAALAWGLLGGTLASLAGRARRPALTVPLVVGALACGFLATRVAGVWTLAFVLAVLGSIAALLVRSAALAARAPVAIGRFFLLLLIVAASVTARALLLEPRVNRIEDWLLLDHVRQSWPPDEYVRGITTIILLGIRGQATFGALFALNSVACALYAVPAYFLARSWFDDRLAGWVAALLVASHPFLLDYGRTGDYHAVGNLAFLASLAAAFRYRARRDAAVLLLSAGFAMICAIAQTETLLVLAPVLLAVWFLRAGPGPDRTRFLAVATASVVGLAPRVRAFLTPTARDIDESGMQNTVVGAVGEGGGLLTGLLQMAGWVTNQIPPALAALILEPSRMPAVTALGLVGLWVLWISDRRFLAVGAGLAILGIVATYYGTHRSMPGEHPHQDVLPLVMLATLASGAVAWALRQLAGFERILVAGAMTVAFVLSVGAAIAPLDDAPPGSVSCEQRTLAAWVEALPAGASLCAFNPERLGYLGGNVRNLDLCDARKGAKADLDARGPLWVVLARSLTTETPDAPANDDLAWTQAMAFLDAIGYRVEESQPVQCFGSEAGNSTFLVRAVPEGTEVPPGP